MSKSYGLSSVLARQERNKRRFLYEGKLFNNINKHKPKIRFDEQNPDRLAYLVANTITKKQYREISNNKKLTKWCKNDNR